MLQNLYTSHMPYADPSVQKQYLHEYSKTYHQSRYATRIAEMVKYLGGKCVECGTINRLEFDHIDPSTKEFSITRKWNRKWSILEPELKKCQLLCYDCHKERTAMQRRGLV